MQTLEVELLNARFAQLTEFVKEVRSYEYINIILTLYKSFKPEFHFSSMPVEVRQTILKFVGLDLQLILKYDNILISMHINMY